MLLSFMHVIMWQRCNTMQVNVYINHQNGHKSVLEMLAVTLFLMPDGLCFNILETAELLKFSHITVSRVDTE